MGRSGYGMLVRSLQAAQRQQMAQQRAHARMAREVVRAQRVAVAWNEKETKRLHLEACESDAFEQTQEVEIRIRDLSGLLICALQRSPKVDFQSLKMPFAVTRFEPGSLAVVESAPDQNKYLLPPLPLLARLFPFQRRKYEEAVKAENARFEDDLVAYVKREQFRIAALNDSKTRYEVQAKERVKKVASQHTEVDRFSEEVRKKAIEVIPQYITLLLARDSYPEGFPQTAKVAYVAESAQLVIEYDLPNIQVIPDVVGFRYVKSKDEIVSSPLPTGQRRALYVSVVAQTVLRTLYSVFESDYGSLISSVVFNGHVDAVDPGTGKSIRPCIVSLRTSRDVFRQLELGKVEPASCLRILNASISKSPSELAAVRPILEFKMVDPRFIEGADVLSNLDERPNLMDLNPMEFEALIANLFAKMGLETRQTRASRDGGVDCIAYDPRPILGGKVVIQAKRYRNTVGVSAVRDLFGTLQNEGASKGILVTTSGYGRAAFEFADGKPIELLSGSHLLFLLAEHAGIDAKIVMPEDWFDIVPDSPCLDVV